MEVNRIHRVCHRFEIVHCASPSILVVIVGKNIWYTASPDLCSHRRRSNVYMGILIVMKHEHRRHTISGSELNRCGRTYKYSLATEVI